MEFHPDRNKTPGAEDKFKEINEAYQVLSDQEKRTRYDRFGHAGVNGGGERGFDGFDPFGGFGDIFDTFFGGGGRTANQPRSGEDISHRVNLTFEEAVFGCDKDIEINRVEPCHHCSGAGNEPGTAINTCRTCNGSGQVRRAQRSVFGSVCGDHALLRLQWERPVHRNPMLQLPRPRVRTAPSDPHGYHPRRR